MVSTKAGDRLLGRCEEIITEHQGLTDLLRSGDAAAFAAALRDHIAETGVKPLSSFGFDGITTFPPASTT